MMQLVIDREGNLDKPPLSDEDEDEDMENESPSNDGKKLPWVCVDCQATLKELDTVRADPCECLSCKAPLCAYCCDVSNEWTAKCAKCLANERRVKCQADLQQRLKEAESNKEAWITETKSDKNGITCNVCDSTALEAVTISECDECGCNLCVRCAKTEFGKHAFGVCDKCVKA